jgi:two-component system, NarL family, response regulator NreC
MQTDEQIGVLIALGRTNQQVSARLGVSVKTAEVYKSPLMTRLGMTGRAALVRCALGHGPLEE